MVAQQRVGAGAVDHDFLRLERRHRLFRRQRALDAFDWAFPTLGNQSGQAFFDILQPTEPLIPTLKQGKKVWVNGAPEVEPSFKFTGFKDGADVVTVNFVGAVR